jgi:hypothetical protein
MDAVVRDPTIVTGVVTLPFYQVFEPAVAHPTVKNVLDLELFVTADQYRWRRWCYSASWDGVGLGGGQFHDRENRV